MTAIQPASISVNAPELHSFVDDLRHRHHDRIGSVLLYGSCLRSGDFFDGIVDLYLIADDYRSIYDGRALALANWVLPPNVFYREQRFGDRTLRAKVTVISLADFRRGCSRSWFESYIWGRFAQPVAVLYSRDQAIRADIDKALQQAATTLLGRALPVLPADGTVTALWEQALSLSYATELRSERNDRSTSIVEYMSDFYLGLARRYAEQPNSGLTVSEQGGDWRYHYRGSGIQRVSGRGAWLLRRLSGKVLSILRLIKALYTFDVGLDYLAWKLERHTGQEVVIPAKVRRAPLIHIWGFAWRLYRRGIFK